MMMLCYTDVSPIYDTPPHAVYPQSHWQKTVPEENSRFQPIQLLLMLQRDDDRDRFSSDLLLSVTILCNGYYLVSVVILLSRYI